MSTPRTPLIADLQDRGLIAHVTDLDALDRAVAGGPITTYVGFDPTAPSLHMGNLMQILTLRRMQLAGNHPLPLVGGATGLIGDPKDTAERAMNAKDTVHEWMRVVQSQLERFLDFDGPYAARLVNNYEWTKDLNTLDFLRDVGKHFSVNRMLGREVVRARLESGISYTEFSYVLLQSMDYLELFRRYGCTLQTGGSDQWGNITAGADLIRRVEGEHVHALATPLVTKADGTKYGKTAGGTTLWLDPDMLSPYAFHQFWLNVEDASVGKLLAYFTFLDRDEITDLVQQTEEKPYLRAAQRRLADEVTTLVHGEAATSAVSAAARALFGQAELAEADPATLRAAIAETATVEVRRGEAPAIVDLLVGTGLAQSRSAARRTIGEGGAYLNNAKVTDPDAVLSSDDWLPGGTVVLRRGKRNLAGALLVDADQGAGQPV